jgi:oligopeptide/dipeptide ABC transporter ATP-binding protein
MYLGRLVEIAPSRQLVTAPRHPYTQALLAAVPEPDPAQRKTERPVRGDIPSPIDRPRGCAFHPRCPLAQAICREQEPELRLVAHEQLAACHFA